MPKIREFNEEESFKFDEIFKETLVHVKRHILALTCAKSAELCIIWLNKLYDASSQRLLRNEYLMELYRQLRAGRVGGIFNTLPPNGSLLPLPKSYHMVPISSAASDISDYTVRPHRNCVKTSSKCIQHQRSKAPLNHCMMDMPNMNQCMHTNPLPTVRFPDQKVDDRNGCLWNHGNEYSKSHNENMGDFVSESISQLTTDVTSLKAKVLEMEKLKSSQQQSYKEAVQEYHSAVIQQLNELQRQSNDARIKNEALDNSVAVIAKKLEEIINGKSEDNKLLEEEWMNTLKIVCERFDSLTKEKNQELQMKQDLLDKRDVELSKKDAERKEEMDILTNKICDLEMKLEMKIRDGEKLQAMVVEQYANMKEEFNKMRSEVDFEAQKQYQILTSKVASLKKTALKLEKSKEKLEYDYERKLSSIIKNKDAEIKALQLQLHEQRNELCTSLSTKKQSEVNNIVSILEKRYKTLLAEAEAMSENQTQEYLKKIAILEEQVINVKKF